VKRGRAAIVTILIIALLATGAMQMTVQQQRQKLRSLSGAGQPGGSSSLSRMDSYALALLLGGLRGPLVMFLWPASEAQKSSRDLAGIDTQIEWIRLLQVEFDTVHLFQIWNKAYNLSVQMASLSNKYATILDAIEYGRSVDVERPDNIHIISQIGQVYGDKLGNSAEKDYYRRRVRQDSLYRAQRLISGSSQRRMAMPPLLDAQGNLLSELVSPRLNPPLSKMAMQVVQSYDGAELQYLRPYQPFPYGVSANALAYNYYKRAQVLQDVTGQRHLQMSEMVVDSRPALALESWASEEWELGRRAEIQAWSIKPPYEKLQLESPTAAQSLTSLSGQQLAAGAARLDEAIYCYGRAKQLFDDSDKEFHRHMINPQYADSVTRYAWHMDQIHAVGIMMDADLAFLKAMRLEGSARDEQVALARDAYHRAIRLFELMRLRYFASDAMRAAILPRGVTAANINQMPAAQVDMVVRELDRRIKMQGGDEFSDDTAEYVTYIQRCQARLKSLQ
jgi:hypothetical protein